MIGGITFKSENQCVLMKFAITFKFLCWNCESANPPPPFCWIWKAFIENNGHWRWPWVNFWVLHLSV